MSDNYMLISTSLQNRLAVSDIIKCNEITGNYGLKLSFPEAASLVQTRRDSLNELGRVEFKGGIISKLIFEFCDSPYISQYNYAETINDLIETFYYYKNETLDELSDDELIALMKDFFDHGCEGSMELLQHRELEKLARCIRFGESNFEEEMEEEEEDYE